MELLENIPVIKVLIGEESGIDKISFVENPAMKENWKLFSETKKFSTDDEEMIIYYPVILADTPIYRDEPFQHYIVFSEPEIKIIRNRLFKNNKHNSFNEAHGPVDINNTYIVESWIKTDDTDKSVKMGFSAPNGSWFIGVKVDDEMYWENKVKKGKFSGLSMEVMYDLDIDREMAVEQYVKSLLNMDLSDEVLEAVVKDILKKM